MHLARRRGLALLAGTAVFALAGCGFQLRRPPPLPFRRIALAGFGPRSGLAEAFRRALARDAQVVEAPAQAELVLEALRDLQEKVVVASTAAVQVRELQLRLSFRFRAVTPSGRLLIPATELMLARDMSYNETQALAKEQEEARLQREMQDDVVAQVLRRLSAVQL